MFFDPLRKALKNSSTRKYDLSKIERAYRFAEKAHSGQKRKSGEDYITHPIAVALNLLNMGADETTIIAALLHDTVEDTALSLDIIQKEFGVEVKKLVDGLTKFEKNTFAEKADLDEKIETLRKWLSVFQQDLRIALIKIADRLDNIKTLDAFPNIQKRIRIAQETLDVYARICEWLSLLDIKEILEREALRYILPQEEYENLLQKSEEKKNKEQELCQHIEKTQELRKMPHLFSWSPWSFSFQEEYFSPLLLSITCIAEDVESCYHAVSFLHSSWQNKKNSFEDFINTPKVNGYQALHTIVLMQGEEVLIRIMTPEMFQYARNGVGTFCFENNGKQRETLPWIQKLNQLVTLNTEKSLEFWNGLQSDLLEGFIVVYDPDGKVLSLPKRSTYLDAAFAFLGEKALFLDAVFVDEKPVTFQTQVEDGDSIQFSLSETPTFSHEWILFVDNTVSMEAIKKALREKNQTEKELLGKKLLQKEFDKNNLGLIEEIDEKALLVSCKDLEIDSFSDLLKKIGEIYIFPEEVVSRIFPQKKKQDGKDDEKREEELTCWVEKDDLGSFFTMVGGQIKKLSVRYTEKWKDILEIKGILRISPEERNSLVHSIRRAPGMRVISIQQSAKSYWFLFALISLLWGLDPIFASLILQNGTSPEFFTIVRFASVFLFMGSFLVFNKIFFRESLYKKSIMPLRYPIFFISLCLFGVALGSYHALQYTVPSDYVLSLYFFIPIIALYELFSETHQPKKMPLLLPTFIISLGLILLFQNPEWSWHGKSWTIVVTILFSIYFIGNDFYQKKQKILSRYFSYHFVIITYCFVFSLILVPFVPRSDVSFEKIALISIFSIVFTLSPYILWLALVKKIQNISLISYRLPFVFIFPLIIETLFWGIPMTFLKFTTAFMVITGALSIIFFDSVKRHKA